MNQDGLYYDSCGNLRQEMNAGFVPSLAESKEIQDSFYYDSCGNLRPGDMGAQEMCAAAEPSQDMKATEHSEDGFYYDSCGNMRPVMEASEEIISVAPRLHNETLQEGLYYDSCGNLRQEMNVAPAAIPAEGKQIEG